MANDPLQFGGVEQFAATSDRVFAVVTDLGTLARVLPDVESSEQPAADTLRCVVRPGFSFLRGKLNVTITRQETDAEAPLSAEFRVESKAIGVQITVETSLRVEATSVEASPVEATPTNAAQSALHWQATVTERKGLVAAISASLIRAAAEKVIQQTWQRLRDELAA
ncbi:MAG: SRPBCC domain-containing protein [Pirellulales bacterium]